MHSVQFSLSVMSNSLHLHGLQHARLPCPKSLYDLALLGYLLYCRDLEPNAQYPQGMSVFKAFNHK